MKKLLKLLDRLAYIPAFIIPAILCVFVLAIYITLDWQTLAKLALFSWAIEVFSPDWVMLQMMKTANSVRVIIFMYLGIVFFDKCIFPGIDFKKAIRESNKNQGKYVTAILVAIILAMGLANIGKANPRVERFRGIVTDTCDEYFSDLVPDCPGVALAQMDQESRGDENARSWVGARGVYQFMPATSKWVQKQLKRRLSALNPEDATDMWGWYMWKQYVSLGKFYRGKKKGPWSGIAGRPPWLDTMGGWVGSSRRFACRTARENPATCL